MTFIVVCIFCNSRLLVHIINCLGWLYTTQNGHLSPFSQDIMSHSEKCNR